MNSDKPINQNIIKYLNQYVSIEDPQFAVLINGKWGSGKTFFIKHLIEQWNKGKDIENEDIKLKAIYVSLNGLSEVNQISTKIKEALNPLLYSKGAQVVKKVFFGVLKSAAHINLDTDGDGKSDGKVSFNIDSLGLLKNDDPKIKGHKILIFDDFERCKIPITEIFGYINEFVEHHKCKVIILSDEKKVYEASTENKEQITYKDFKEKLIGQTFSLEVELDKALDHFTEQSNSDVIKDSKDLIKQIFNASEIENLRILKQALSDFERFVLQIDEEITEHEKFVLFLKNLLGHFLIVYLEHKAGNHEIGNLGDFSLTDEEKDYESKIKSKYDLILDKNDIYHRMSVIPYELVLIFLNNGYIDELYLNTKLKDNGFFRGEDEEDWAKLWYWEVLDDDQFEELFDKVNKDFLEEQFKNPYKLLHVVTILFDLIDNGIIIESKSSITATFKKQVKNILKVNKKETLSTTGDHSWGKGYYGRETSEFKKLRKYLNDSIIKHNSSNKDDYLKKLFEEINDESINQIQDKLDAPLPDRSTSYKYIPILVTVNGEILGKRLLELKPKNLELFFSFIRRRYYPEEVYSNGFLEFFNSEDKDCFIALRDHFREELESLGKIRKYKILKDINFLEQLINKLENLKKE